MPPEGDRIPNVDRCIEISEMYNWEIREAFITIACTVTVQANLNMMPRFVESTMTSRLRDLGREECSMYMLHDDMTLGRHMMYVQ